MSTAIEACAYILRRVQSDSNFAHYMLHTESLHKCVLAVAEHQKLNPDVVKDSIARNAAARMQSQPPRVKQLEVEIEALQENMTLLYEGTQDGGGTMIDLLNYCRVRGERPTIEAIEAALDGQDFGHCIRLMTCEVF